MSNAAHWPLVAASNKTGIRRACCQRWARWARL